MGIDKKDKQQEILKRYIRGTLSIDSKPGVGSSFGLDFSNLSRVQLPMQESH